jgi:CubicO group peptidase (beta-lactamase class C family)
MTRSTLSPERFMADPNRMTGVIFDRGKYVVTPFEPMEPYVTPAGGVYSTASDFSKWMLVNLSGGRLGERQIIRPATLARLHSTGVPTHWSSSPGRIPFGYGFGWNTEVYRGEQHLHHDGGSWDATTVVGLLPQRGIGVTVFANQSQSRLAHGLMRNLLDRFLGVPPGDWVAEETARQHAWEARAAAAGQVQQRPRVEGTRPSRSLSEYTGTYVHPGYGPIAIRLEGGRLIADRTGETAPISHWHYDVFAASSPDLRSLWAPEGNSALLSFSADPTGQISTLQISSAGDIIFKKQAAEAAERR